MREEQENGRLQSPGNSELKDFLFDKSRNRIFSRRSSILSGASVGAGNQFII